MKYWIILSAIISTAWSCGFPGAPAHSTVNLSDDFITEGTVATYLCDRGFELLGPSRKVCLSNETWSPPGIPFCVLNVAAGKAPMQSSVMKEGIPQKAVDSKTSSVFSMSTCTLTERERNPWWYVNLLEPYMVQLVRLDFGQNCCGDHPAIIEVRVGNNRPDLAANPVCNRFEGILEEGRPLFLPCSPPMPGAFVSVHFLEPIGAQMSICEAFVYTDQALPIERCPSFRDQPPGGTATYNGKCYIFYNQNPMKFDDALDFCRARGGSLLDETNPALQGFLSWELWQRHRGSPVGQYWLGAIRDPRDPNNWKWINGRNVTISFWNLPGGSENCARFDGTKGWLWSDTNCLENMNFICQHRPRTCGKPEQPPNSTMIGQSFEVESQVEYYCDDGHVLVGPSTRKCLNSGFFNEFPPNCQYIQCGTAAPIQHGFQELINGTSHYGSIVKYQCNEGFRLKGRGELMCDIDGRWNGPPPMCEPLVCGVLPKFENGYDNSTSSHFLYGDFIEFNCNEGFQLTGDSIVHCQSDGNPSSQLPVCQAGDSYNTNLQDPTLIYEQLPGNSLNPADDLGPFDNKVEDSNPPIVRVRPPVSEEDIVNDVSLRNNKGPAIDRPSYNEDSTKRANIPVGGVIALGVFGGFVFLAAIITTIVILVKKTNGSSKKYVRRHDDLTTSSDASSTDDHGLNKYYKKAWQNLGDAPLERDTEKKHTRGTDVRSGRSVGQEGLRDDSEMTVNDVAPMYTRPEKKRHHHHHHRHKHDHEKGHDRDWRDRHQTKY